MVKRRSKKQPKFTIRQVDIDEFNRLQRNAKRMIKNRKEKFGIDISPEIDLKTNISEFKTRKGFNAWKEAMSKLRYRADLQIKKVDGTVASVKQINQSQREVNVMKRKLNKKDGKFVNKYKVEFSEKQLFKITLQTNVARDMEISRQQYLESIPRFDRKGREIRETKKDKTGGSVIVREKFDPNKIQTPAKVKIREEGLKEVSDPERYSKRENQLKENNIKALREMLGDDAEVVIEYFEEMSNAEFANFFTMYNRSSMGFDYIYQRGEYSFKEGSLADRLEGVLESIETDIGRYQKIRKKHRLMERYN
ncbi:DNA terminal protein [Bacillus phage DLc1]|uniref:Terminal protein n=1 Tax=Bacillus phage DLc1 TaxID=2777318 RepID=A0A7M1RPD2_9CAUD|nr:DNA terminal protein [Bacillus phage DLc1]QOR56267.1 terminal protein [Bacillus phage DLc1]